MYIFGPFHWMLSCAFLATIIEIHASLSGCARAIATGDDSVSCFIKTIYIYTEDRDASRLLPWHATEADAMRPSERLNSDQNTVH